MAAMRKRQWGLIISFGLVAVVTSILILKRISGGENFKPERIFSGEISSFCVNKLCVKKDDSGWWVENEGDRVPGNEEAIGDFTDKFKKLEFTTIVSQNRDKFGEMGIGKDQVVLEINGVQLEIGSATQKYDGFYARKGDDGTVYLSNLLLIKDEISKSDYWQKKLILNLPKYQLKKVTVKYGGKEKILEPKEGKWDRETLVDKLAFLKAIKYLPGGKPSDKDVYIYEIETEKEKTELVVGKYWATTDEKRYFEISKDDYLVLTEKLF